MVPRQFHCRGAGKVNESGMLKLRRRKHHLTFSCEVLCCFCVLLGLWYLMA